MQQGKIKPSQDTLHICFPQVYHLHGCQEVSVCSELLLNVRNNMEKGQWSIKIKEETDQLTLRNLEFGLKHSHFKHMPKFGCSIIAQKLADFKPTHFSLIYLQGWILKSQIKNQEIKYFTSNPGSTNTLQIGAVQYGCDSFQKNCETLFELIDEEITKQIQIRIKNNDKSGYHNPTWLLQVAKKALKQYNSGDLSSLKPQQGAPKKKQEEKIDEEKVISKGGAIEVGKYIGKTKPNTSFEIVEAILEYFCFDKDLVNLMMLDMKIGCLYKTISQNRQPTAQDLENYFDCLNVSGLWITQQNKQRFGDYLLYYQQRLYELHKIIKGDFGYADKEQVRPSELPDSIVSSRDYSFRYYEIGNYDDPQDKSESKSGDLGFKKSIQVPQNCHQLLKSQLDESYWIMQVEQFFFSMAIQFLDRDEITIPLSDQEVICPKNNKSGYSPIHELVRRYARIMTNQDKNRYHGMMLKNQSWSHIFLIKYIGSALVFEKLKHTRKHLNGNLDEYRVQLKSIELFECFSSISFRAWQALQVLVRYQLKNKNKKPIFILQGSNSSFYQYANIVANEDNDIIAWKKEKEKWLQSQISDLDRQFVNYGDQLRSLQKRKSELNRQTCSCTQEKVYYNSYRYYWDKKTCYTCQRLQTVQKKLRDHTNKTFSQIKSPFAQYNINLYAFLNCIPVDLLGLMKIYYEAQISKFQELPGSILEANNFFSSHLYGALVIHTNQVKTKNLQLYLYYKNDASKHVKYPSKHTKNIYFTIDERQNLPMQELSPQKIKDKILNQEYQFMINPIKSDNKIREHEICSKQTRIANIVRQHQFGELGSIRVAKQPQLMVLADVIKRRAIQINCLIKDSKQKQNADNFVKQLVLLNAAADFKSFKKLNEETIQFITQPHIRQSITELLQKYLSGWQFKDLYSLPIVGKIFALFAKQLKLEPLIVKIVDRCIQEYTKFSKENSTGDNSIKSQLAFFLHGTMAFYSEDMTQTLDKNAVHTWLKLMLVYRLNKVFSDQNIKEPKYRNTMLHYEVYRERCIFSNVINVKNYFIKNADELTDLIKLIDQGIDQSTKWQYAKSTGEYVFKGKNEGNTYEINLFTGIILKNGSELTGLPLFVKKNVIFQSIFGINRDLEVYHQNDESLRTRCNFQDFFPNEPDYKVFFQFKIIKEQLIIRTILKKKQNDKQSKYVLIDQKLLQQSNFVLPQLYLKQYYGWLCKQKKHMIFRKKPLEDLHDIGLVQLVDFKKDRDNGDKIITKVCDSRIVENKYRQSTIAYLTNEENQSFFPHLSLFKKKRVEEQGLQNINFGFRILSSIQKPEYVIQTTLYQDKKKPDQIIVRFWLHRYGLTFTLSSQLGLLSDNYQGYSVDRYYRQHDFVPFSKFCKVHCLILKKYDLDLRFSKNHNYMLLVPDTPITLSQVKNELPSGELRKMSIISYEIHNHLKDIRGKRRLDQLHLACLLTSCYQEVFEPLMMSNVEYAMSVLRSCINNLPLTSEQMKKLQNIIKMAIKIQKPALILQCQAIYKITECLRYVLPFNNQKIPQLTQERQATIFQKQSDLIQNCKYQYRQKKQNKILPLRENLATLELQILNMTHFENQPRRQYLEKVSEKIDISSRNKKDLIKIWLQGINQLKICEQNTKQILNKQLMITEDSKQVQKEQQKIDDNQIECNIAKEQAQQIRQSKQAYQISQIENNKIRLTAENKHNYIDIFSRSLSKITIIKNKLVEKLTQAQLDRIRGLDMLMKQASVIKERDFTSVLCEDNGIKKLNPSLSQVSSQFIKKKIELWMRLTVKCDSLERTIQILRESQQVDKVILRRELQSPRDQIQQNLPWLCFQVEMKTQIWKPQYETFKLLNSSTPGTYTQLNMGEGKTQVIIPMMVLDQIYNKKQYLPRVNILSPLYRQAQDNYYKFLSVTGFRINIIPIYFNRTVSVRQENIFKMQYVIDVFSKKALVMSDRDSSLSIILKLREQCGFKNMSMKHQLPTSRLKKCNKKDIWLFRDIPVLDIYDEVDALMTAKKSFVYAVGAASPLPSQLERFEFSRKIIEIIVKEQFDFLFQSQIAVLEESIQHSKERIKLGSFPKGIRFMTKVDDKTIKIFRSKIVNHFLGKRYIPSEFEFYNKLNPDHQAILKEYLIDEVVNIDVIEKLKVLPEQVYIQIYAVRGLLAYGIIEHCFSLRNGVDYGVPGTENPKRVGVPYEAADVPSKRSEYSHPDVATSLSYLAYYSRGLTFKQFQQALKCLLGQTKSARDKNYKAWIDCIEEQEKKPQQIIEPKQINLESLTQRKTLYECFKNCRNTISFWLIYCVFPTDLTQYLKSITASSWDLASSCNSVGFTGTKDTRWTMPEYLSLKMSPNNEIKGTDGKMISLMLQNTLGVKQIKINTDDLWKRFVQTSLELQVGCIIDAGAVLAGKSLENEIVPWICGHQLFKKLNFRGIMYCNENGQWKIYDVSSRTIIKRQTSIPQHETFVIFDEARTRGADIKMKTQTVAVLSLGPNMTKDKMMQAVGRLRKFGRKQQIHILGTRQIFNTIENFNVEEMSTQDKTNSIIKWVCENSVKDNKKMLYPNMKLAWIHFQNKYSTAEVVAQQFDPTLETMYKNIIEYERLQKINQRMAQDFVRKYENRQEIIHLVDTIEKYGSGYQVKCQNLEDICERQIQMVQEQQKQIQREMLTIYPVKQTQQIQKSYQPLSTINFKFNDRLTFSKNFLNCTERKSNFPTTALERTADNQLCKINFVRIYGNPKRLMVITQQQVDILYAKGVPIMGPESIYQEIKLECVVRFSDLSLKIPLIEQNDLRQALVDAQFFNGQQKFEDPRMILETMKNNLEKVKKTDIQKLVCHFLERRGTLEDLYYSSDLEEVYKRLTNSL